MKDYKCSYNCGPDDDENVWMDAYTPLHKMNSPARTTTTAIGTATSAEMDE